ncbi:C-type lectin domain family 4 member M-like [Stegastes partitus]|uniref:C-type lectin domain family 4 member M-like n=2 Tax=Stegastes partitus TaxID=144197 RepID=A0A9Y4JUQ8_9TELE|nr:PREDICTED: C-type lectin domain family 4 member M-like [Stegastes partitus]
MISNADGSTDGKSSNARSKGSPCMVRVGSRSLPMYPLAIGCLGLLNTILLLTAVVIGIYCGSVNEKPSLHQITPNTLIEEVKQLQMIQKDVMETREATRELLAQELQSHKQKKQQLEPIKALCDNLQRQIEVLRVEKATLQADSFDILHSCGRCLPGWFLLSTSCYFHAKTLKNWADSRADCISRGADLAVIDSLDEQLNLFEYLPKAGSSRPWGNGGIWIGLTDIQREGTWVWVNNATLYSDGYWMHGEPSDHGLLNKDCVALWNTGSQGRSTWYDGSCQSIKGWLCEKELV